MTTPPSDQSDQIVNEPAEKTEPLARLASSEVVVKAREVISRLVNRYPASTVLGAFAIGFAVARLVRSLREED